ncbi:Sugar lactone lactonase YvrE [Actinokineospora alba]|uniref:Sugar lactone lactonase YvrE n=1 Tax=Actinokineospora alba TaxID=504798 RepID=A0A1H0R2I8_9PSEU|nr:SMP-30/gluconolactonase/LRE family protein [Actinokineospora alba]TDP70278.1 sugar lactone lactonase YvrE [Actinokineospora alba]SDI35134.1 Sugar lactone lactonase YvrE [Actinokineospora alba]SDP23732.1 Sugar lactone lactonase YvrE [Actinokineospora alba]
MTPEIVVDAGARLGEGPVWDVRAQRLYWVDILGKSVHVHDPSGLADEVFDVGTHVGSLAVREQGGLVLAVADGFRAFDFGSTSEIAVVTHPGPPARFNDGKCDPSGSFWAGTMPYDQEPGAGIVYRLDPDHSVRPVLPGVTVSNGLDFTPDGRTLYYIDTPTGRIDAFDVDAGVLSGRRTVVEVSAGSPDGLTLDADGCLWVALWGGSAVHRYTPDGRLDRVVDFPVSRPTCPVFGGADLGTLYVTSASVGVDEPHAGALFALEVGVKGLPANRFGG